MILPSAELTGHTYVIYIYKVMNIYHFFPQMSSPAALDEVQIWVNLKMLVSVTVIIIIRYNLAMYYIAPNGDPRGNNCGHCKNMEIFPSFLEFEDHHNHKPATRIREKIR